MGWRWAAVVTCMAMAAATAGLLPGRMVDQEGQGVAGAAVWLLVHAGDESTIGRRAVTGDDGGFAFDLSSAAARPALVVARVPGRGCVGRDIKLPCERIDLRLEPGNELAGEVTDTGGRPLAGVTSHLAAFPSTWPEWRLPAEALNSLWRAETGADGMWRLREVPSGLPRRMAIRGQRTTLHEPSIGRGYQWLPACASILEPGGELSGRLLRADGTPAAGVKLQAAGQRARCDARGWFTFEHVPSGRELTLGVDSGCGCSWSPGRTLGRARVGGPPPVLRLPGMGRVRGRVRTADGQPVAGRMVGVNGAVSALNEGRTGPDGRYELDVWTGSGRVWALDNGQIRETPVRIKGGQTVTAPDLIVRRSVRRLRVVDAAGQPAARATVWVSSGADERRPLTTDDQGRLVITREYWSSSDRFTLATAEPFALATGKLLLDAPEVTFTLAALPLAERRTTGVVLDDAGQPVAGARVALTVALTQPDWLTMGDVVTVTTDAQGRWDAGDLPRRATVIGRVSAAGYRSGRFQIAAGGLAETRLERRDATVSGQVLDRAGRPVAGALVYAEGCLDDKPAVSGADGSFTCGALPHGRLMLVAQRGRCDLARVTCDAPAEGLRLTLAPTPASVWQLQPSEADIERARRAIEARVGDGADFGSEEWLALLATLDPNDVLDRLTRVDPARDGVGLAWLLESMPHGAIFDEQLVRLVRSLPSASDRLRAARHASDHLPGKRRDLHVALLATAREAAAQRRPDPRWLSGEVDAAAALATLALRAGESGRPELAALVDAYRRDVASWEPHTVTMPATLPVTLVDTLTPHYPSADLLCEARCKSLCRLFAVSPDDAWATARRWWPGANGRVAWPFKARLRCGSRDKLAGIVARWTLARYGAGAIERLPDLSFPQALACALACEDVALARRFAAIAEARSPGVGQSTSARLALVAGIDPAMAERCRRQVLAGRSLGPHGRDDSSDRPQALLDGSLNVAYGLARVDPNRSRWLAETVYSLGRPEGGALTQAVLAMAAVDPARAGRMVAALGSGDAEALALTRWLLSDRGERAGTWLGSDSGSYTVFAGPGE